MATPTVEISKLVPGLAAERPVVWPKRTRVTLPNGLQVVLAEAHSIPKFHGELYFRAGNALVADRSPSLAEMTATLVRTGTGKRTSRQIEEDLRRLGADLGTSAGQDTSAISFAGLSEFAEPILKLVNELAREASFPEARTGSGTATKAGRGENGTDLPGISGGRAVAQGFVRQASLRGDFAERGAGGSLQAG